MFEKNLVEYKMTPSSEWKPWPYLPPVKGTLEILQREGQRALERAMRFYNAAKKKGLAKSPPTAYCLFYGEKIWGFRFKKTGEMWNIEKGFTK